MRFREMLIIFALVNPAIARSEPNPTTNYLMDEPISMFTYGMDKIDRSLRNAVKDTGIFTNAAYNWDQDRIYLNATCFQCETPATEKSCAEIITKIRNSACIANGKPVFGNHSCYSAEFAQNGYSKKTRPKDVETSMDQKFIIQVTFSNSDIGKLQCEAPLIGTGYSVKK